MMEKLAVNFVLTYHVAAIDARFEARAVLAYAIIYKSEIGL